MTPQDFIALQGQVKTLADIVAASSDNTNKVGKSLIEAFELITRIRIMLHVNHLAIGALAMTHPDKEKALEQFKKMWQVGRGPLGAEHVTDETRTAIQQEVDEIAKSLGGKIL